MARLRRGVGRALVLDAEGLSKLAHGNAEARSYFEDAREAKGQIVTPATTLTEVIRGGRRDAQVHRVLKRVTVLPVEKQTGREAGELLGRTGLSGHRCALDALVAVVALAQQRPVVLLTSDTDGLARLTEEPGRAKAEGIAVVRI